MIMSLHDVTCVYKMQATYVLCVPACTRVCVLTYQPQCVYASVIKPQMIKAPLGRPVQYYANKSICTLSIL